MMKEDRTTCLKYVNHYRRNSEHNWENLYNHLTTRRIFTFDNDFQGIHTSSKTCEDSGYEHIWIC